MEIVSCSSSSSETSAESETVSVCLKCGNEGFEETLVYCFKCQGYALHRYCLDGPVVFTDEVIWFCEDCDVEVIDVDSSDNEIVDSKNDEVSFSEDWELGVIGVDFSDKAIADSKNTEVNSSEDFDQDTADSEKFEVDSGYGCENVADSHPIADPIWRGSLRLINKSFELMAHLSSLACPRVHEVSRHLPNVLYADLFQRSSVWPNLFMKFGAQNIDIGLYFFPQNERVERLFDELVYEMIFNDLVIRAEVEVAELLIFSSTTLPSEYRRIQSKYYLWGLFRKKQTPS
ncbi:unnamed protein product [Vicia faba]|uniref:AIPP2-like SPOC-like domain-containing protein n=1 Tax=Vicia faba TaxID=3906 RepID=A0AAV0Z5J5_VICFA|nr:unnamed protein product [Vicia faba]